MGKFAITMTEYNRIHQVIHGVIKHGGKVERACTFFSIVGSHLLNERFGIPSAAVAGGFALCVDEGPKCVVYGKEDGGRLGWGDDGFHMWVQTEDYVIDFMAPLYEESFAIAEGGFVIPRKMFQKHRAGCKQELGELQGTGEYLVFPDPELSKQKTDRFFSRPGNADLLQVIDAWFGKRRGRQKPTMTMGINDDTVRHLRLPSTIARSPW